MSPGQPPLSEQRPEIQPAIFPKTSGEFITVLAHYYRAEIARMAGWRDRIDRTSNWAITVVAALLSVSLSSPTAHHGVLLFAMLLVLLLLSIESRRYRFFDVYRARVRRLERNYFAQILAPEIEPEFAWTQAIGEDLRRPLFLISRSEALYRRLRRNYCWMFFIVLLAWLLKISSGKVDLASGRPEFVHSWQELLSNAALGPVHGGIILGVVALFYAWIAYGTLRRRSRQGELAHGEVHV